jgi:bifunctional non-homologous end joining protein LigD
VAKLSEYRRKRKFQVTPEPKGKARVEGHHKFVVQRHAARRLHYDFRLEIDGVLKSWAVPKGPPDLPGEKRLAVHVEDHPIEYGSFEGQIPKGNYGAGDVQIWDRGTFEPEGPLPAGEQVRRGEIKFRLYGQRLKGSYVLVKMRRSDRGNEWLFLKHNRPDFEEEESTAAQAATSASSSKKSAALSRTGRKAALTDLQAKFLPGAKRSAMPQNPQVALATLIDKPFSNSNWLFEVKWDGERALAYLQGGELTLQARSGRIITQEFPDLHNMPKQVMALKAILDGEIVVLDESGHSDFQRLQKRFGAVNPPAVLQKSSPATYYAFDLLFCDGYDLRKVPLVERKRFLEQIIQPTEFLRYSAHEVEKGQELYNAARDQQLEGILAKQSDSPYVSGRTQYWLKLKILHEVDVVIGGWTAPRKTRDYFGSLLMGLFKGADLIYVGNVGTGFSQESLESIYKRLQQIERPKSPFSTVPKLKERTWWTEPQFVARIRYGQWTSEGRLRQPAFLGFREDRTAKDCQMEGEVPQEVKPSEVKPSRPRPVLRQQGGPSQGAAPAVPTTLPEREAFAPEPRHSPARTAKTVRSTDKHSVARKLPSSPSLDKNLAAASADAEKQIRVAPSDTLIFTVEGKELRLSNLNKIYFPKERYTKRDLLAYYAHVAPYILPFLKDRPMVMRRYPNGVDGKTFFQKEAPSPRPDWLKIAMIASKERGGEMPYALANDLASLLFLTNLGCIDHNPWSSRPGSEKSPDYLFFDLDPTDGTPFENVVELASVIQEILEAASIKTFLKTSGATGFHIYLPLEEGYTYEEARTFADAIVEMARAKVPQLITTERAVRRRPKGRVLIDTLQNAHGKPLAAAYAVRAFPGAPVSAPISPRELKKGLQANAWNIRTMPARLAKVGDLWADFWQHRLRLEDAASRFV